MVSPPFRAQRQKRAVFKEKMETKRPELLVSKSLYKSTQTFLPGLKTKNLCLR